MNLTLNKEKYTNKRIIICSTLLLFLFYNTNYKFLHGIPTSYISLFIIILFSILSVLSTGRIKIKINSATYFSLFLFLWSLASYTINLYEPDIYLVRSSFLYFTICIFYPIIYKFVFLENKLLLLKSIGYAGLINGIFIILMLTIKSFQLLYLQFIDQSSLELIQDKNVLDSAMSLRMVGITGFSAYSTGFVQVLCATCYLLYVFCDRKKLKFPDIVILIFIFISAILSARSSLVGIFIFTLIFLILFKIKALIRFSLLLLVFLPLLVFLITQLVPSDFKNFFINWLTEIFSSGTKTGSLQANMNMFIYGWSDFSLIGDSKWYGNNNDYYMKTDVGWYRILFSVGYIGLFIWLLTIVTMIKWTNIFSPKLSKVNLISILIIIYIVIINFKGAILFDSFQSIFIILSIGTTLDLIKKCD